jgi:hypothetical protein
MSDVLYLLTVLIAFAALVLLVRGCDHLAGRRSFTVDPTVRPERER